MTTLNIPVEVTSPPTGILVQADVATAQPGQTVQLLVRDIDTDAVIPAAALSLIRGGGGTFSPPITGNDGAAALSITGAPGRYTVLAVVGSLSATLTLLVLAPGELPDAPQAFTVGDVVASRTIDPENFRSFDDLVADAAAALQVRGQSSGLLDLSPGSVMLALLEACAAQGMWLQAEIAELLAKSRAATASGTALDSWLADFAGFARQDAVPASGTVIFRRSTTTAAASVPVGAMVGIQGNARLYQVVADAGNLAYANGAFTLAPGVASLAVAVQCVSTGVGGNAAGGAVNTIGSALPGIDSVTNPGPFTNGKDQESDDDVRARFALWISSLAKGNLDAVAYAIETAQPSARYTLVESIDYASGAQRLGYFYVVADDGSGAPPASFLASIKAAINDVRPIGSLFEVFYPQPLIANISMTVTVAAGATASAVRSLVSQAVASYVSTLSIGQTLPITRLAQVAYDASDSVANVSGIAINGAGADLAASGKQVVRAGTITVS